MKDRAGELKDLVEEWANAELAGDVAFLTKTLADDFIGIGPLGFMLTKEQWLARFETGDLAYEAFAIDEVKVRLYGDAAVATCRQTQAGTYQGQAVDVMQGEFRATLVFVEHEGRWRLAGLHLSPIAGPPPGR